jgi:fido (protein-threonine AMPylation protein)
MAAAATSSGSDSPGRAAGTAFAAAVEEFERSQLDRQSATLASHVSRNPDKAEAVVAQHRQAVAAAMRFGAEAATAASSSSSHSITVQVLCEWHRTACEGVIASTAGQIRDKAVRVGHVSFRHARDVRADLVKVCNGLSAIEARLRTLDVAGSLGGGHPSHTTLGSRAALFASVVFFAVVDTHAFADGNGRLARIAANYALRRFGFPVPVALFATPSQRKEYTKATVQTRQNLYLLARGNVIEQSYLEAFAVAGAFTPLLKLFLDRMEKAVAELTNLVHDKQRLVQEEAHHQAASHSAMQFRWTAFPQQSVVMLGASSKQMRHVPCTARSRNSLAAWWCASSCTSRCLSCTKFVNSATAFSIRSKNSLSSGVNAPATANAST